MLQARRLQVQFPMGVTGIFHWLNPTGHTMALGLTHSLPKMSTRNISWGVKVHLHVPVVMKSGYLNLLEPSGPVQACTGIALPQYKSGYLCNVEWIQEVIITVCCFMDRHILGT